MRRNPRPFPAACLPRLERSDLELIEESGHRRWIPDISACASELARRLGLRAARLEVARVLTLRTEDLREVFEGRWRFAVMKDPVGDRTGFLALDPLLLGRLLARIQPDRPAQAGWTLAVEGEDGAIGWVLAYALFELSDRDQESFGCWRFLGLCESAGEIGRNCYSEDALVATWIAVEAGWDRGFAVWIETASSVRRRRPIYGGVTEGEGLDRVSGLKLILQVLLGTSRLTSEELIGIEVGDVVMLDGYAERAEVCLRLGFLFVRGKNRGGKLVIESVKLCEGGGSMKTGEILSAGSGPTLDATDVGRLLVEVTAEAGRVELTVAQLAMLAAGDVVTLPEAVLGPVELRAGSALVARGELVDVDGRRGVRILEVPPRFGGRDEDA